MFNFCKTSKIIETEKYIADNIKNVNVQYKNIFHFDCPIGWMNDTNGVCYAFGKYHLFFQYHPYSANWGPMHWGHAISDDLVNWEFVGVALAPEDEFDKDGCFSGSAYFENDTLYLLYTGISGNNQEQVLASSKDGINFIKHGVVIDNKSLPNELLKGEFRDPRIFKYENEFYTVVGSKSNEAGCVVMYKSSDLYNWEFVNIIYRDYQNKIVCECPDMIIDGDNVFLIYGGTYTQEDFVHQNSYANICVAGNLDFTTGEFIQNHRYELDYGFDMYGVQILHHENDNVLMGWMGSWGRNYYTANNGWAGSCIFPRKILTNEYKLYQIPLTEKISNLKTTEEVCDKTVLGGFIKYEKFIENGVYSLDIDLLNSKELSVDIFDDGENKTTIKYDKFSGLLVLYSETNCANNLLIENDPNYKRQCFLLDNKEGIQITLIIDVSSLEIFLNNGEKSLTLLTYRKTDSSDLTISADDSFIIKNLKKLTLG